MGFLKFMRFLMLYGAFIELSVTGQPKVPPEIKELSEFYVSEVKDDLVEIEKLKCGECPRIYLPVCASDHKTYTNVCQMNCVSKTLKLKRPKIVNHVGICFQFVEPYDY